MGLGRLLRMAFALDKEQAFVVEKRSILSITSHSPCFFFFFLRARYIIFIIYLFFRKIPYYILVLLLFCHKFIYYILLLTSSFKTFNMVVIVITIKSKTIWQRTHYKYSSLIHSILVGLKFQLPLSLSSLLFSSPLSQYFIDSSSLCSFISLSLCLHVHADRFYASSS